MAVRTRTVYPDTVINTPRGQIAVVSENAYLDAVAGAAQMQQFSGGILTIQVSREPTGVDHERVTTAALITWQDRTDARPQPERAAQVVEPPQAIEPSLFERTETEETTAHAAADSIGDGLDLATLEEEDLSAVPEALR
jgi:hypothetical protein